GDETDDRHQQVIDHRLDEPAKRSADDDADSKVNHVALEGEFPEFLKHGFPPSPRKAAAPPRYRPPRIRAWNHSYDQRQREANTQRGKSEFLPFFRGFPATLRRATLILG